MVDAQEEAKAAVEVLRDSCEGCRGRCPASRYMYRYCDQTVDSVVVDLKGMSAAKEFMIQDNMRLHHEYYSRIEGGHGVRDIVEAHTKPKVQLRLTLRLEAVLTFVTRLVRSLKDSRINTVYDDSNLLCPIVLMVVSALCLLLKMGGEVEDHEAEVHDKEKREGS